MTRETRDGHGETKIIFTTEALKQMFGAMAEQSGETIEVDASEGLPVPAIPPGTISLDEAMQRASERDDT